MRWKKQLIDWGDDMAVIKFIRNNSMTNLLRYCSNPKKVGAVSSLNCSLNPRREMLLTRKLWKKNKGTQGIHLVQSFDGYEVDRDTANKIGLELAKQIAGDFECIIYTHVDADNVHNHIVINAVNFKTGRKFHQVNYKKGSSKIRSTDVNLRDVRDLSDQLCRDHGLSVIDRPYARDRRNRVEREKGNNSWRTELKESINSAKNKSMTFGEFRKELNRQGIEVKLKGNNIIFKHPETNRNIRGTRLGEDFTRSSILETINRSPADCFQRIQEIRGEMRNETDPAKSAELRKDFEDLRQRLDTLTEREPARDRGRELGRSRG